MIQDLKRISLPILLLFASGAFGQNEIPPETKAQIDQLIENYISTKNIPGLGLAVVKNDGELLYTRGYGLADVENGKIVNDTSLFAIGSITKSFTATLVVKVLSEMFPGLGASVLDTPIRVLAPGYNFTLGDRYRTEKTSFRDLLAHKVCVLPELAGMWMVSYKDSDDFHYRQRYAPQICPFRNEMQYNNGLISLAGDIIAFLANTTFNEMLSDLFLKIGMTDSTYVKDTDDHNNMEGRTIPYYSMDGVLMRYNTELMKTVTIVNPAGGILSSAKDMAKYMEFHLNLGRVGGNQIVPEDAMMQLRQVSIPVGAGYLKTVDNPNSTIDYIAGYALCLAVGVYDGWLQVYHDGYLPPYESLMNLYPDLGLGIFTTLNGPGYTGLSDSPMGALQHKIFNIIQRTKSNPFSSKNSMFGLAKPYKNFKSKLFVKNELTSAKISLDEVAGTFGSGLNGQVNITLRVNEDGELQAFMEYGVWAHGWLTQISDNIFQINWVTDVWQMAWTQNYAPSEYHLIFSDIDTVDFTQDGYVSTTSFIRNLTVDQLPEVPYAPDSCGQDTLYKKD